MARKSLATEHCVLAQARQHPSTLSCDAGTLPSGLVQAYAPGQVYGLDLSHNKLSGPLPALNATVPTLWTVSIGWNQLEGTIPDSWSPLMLNSEVFDIRQMRLSGALPPSFANANVTLTPYM